MKILIYAPLHVKGEVVILTIIVWSQQRIVTLLKVLSLS
jgi:hypothetical protein